jgi:hypothetical protein
MKKGYSLAILALLGYISTTEALKLNSYTTNENNVKSRDWDDLLGD